MKKLFMMACTAVLLVSCGGTGNAYVDEVVSLTEDFISASEDVQDTKELSRLNEDFNDNVRKAGDEFSAEKKEYERGLEDFEESAHKADKAYKVAMIKYLFYYGKAADRLKNEEKK